MDDLDVEIRAATQAARARIWRRRRAWIATLAVFFVSVIASATTVYSVFPEPEERELEALERQRKARGEALDVVGVTDNYRAYLRDRGHGRWKVLFVLGVSFGIAILVLNRLEPKDDT